MIVLYTSVLLTLWLVTLQPHTKKERNYNENCMQNCNRILETVALCFTLSVVIGVGCDGE